MRVPEPSDLDAFIDAADRAVTKERLFELFVAVMASMAFDRVNFSIMFDRELDPKYWGFGLISTYPLDWQGYYVDRDLGAIDPVRRRAWGLAPPFWWREIFRDPYTTEEQIKFLHEGEAAGLYNGLGIPFRGPAEQRAGIALATSIRRLIIPANIGRVVAVANHFYAAYKRICRSQVFLPATQILNEMERDILTRAAHGRKDQQIAENLGLSLSGINWYFRQIFAKLGVTSRTEAVAFAIHNGIIEYRNDDDYRFR